MKFYEAIELIDKEFIPLIHQRFKETYPDTFIHCTTHDKEVYDSSNPCMYTWYINIANSVRNTLGYSPKYRVSSDDYNDYSGVRRMYEDFRESENWERFLFKNISTRL